MPIYDYNLAGVTQEIGEIADYNLAGARWTIGEVWDYDIVGARREIYRSTQYIVQNGVALVPWSRADVEQFGNRVDPDFHLGYFGLGNVMSPIGGELVVCASMATNDRIDLSRFNNITFVFTRWARDETIYGFYHTSAGVYDNRTVGRNGYSWDPALAPSSQLRGFVCNQAGVGTYTLDISGISSGYIGLASGAGGRGNGYNVVSDIYLS